MTDDRSSRPPLATDPLDRTTSTIRRLTTDEN